MAEWTQFRGEDRQARTACELCETLVPDAIDEVLSADEMRWFQGHVAECNACAELWSESQLGAAWMGVLSTQTPEPSPALLDRILANTSLAGPGVNPVSGAAHMPQAVSAPPAATIRQAALNLLPRQRPRVLPFRVPAQRPAYIGMHPRLMMTAAMAFFSLMLTANMLGIQPEDLRPGHFGSAVRRTLADAGNSAVRTFQNNPVVSQVESRVDNRQAGGPTQ